jgi:hypothetical protein
MGRTLRVFPALSEISGIGGSTPSKQGLFSVFPVFEYVHANEISKKIFNKNHFFFHLFQPSSRSVGKWTLSVREVRAWKGSHAKIYLLFLRIIDTFLA